MIERELAPKERKKAAQEEQQLMEKVVLETQFTDNDDVFSLSEAHEIMEYLEHAQVRCGDCGRSQWLQCTWMDCEKTYYYLCRTFECNNTLKRSLLQVVRMPIDSETKQIEDNVTKSVLTKELIKYLQQNAQMNVKISELLDKLLEMYREDK